MRSWVASVTRFLIGGTIVTTFSFGISTLVSKESWNSYYNGTIYRVQTTDFNILSHTLPTKLSYLLLVNDEIEIQRTLNSNYGLFGIVVTDCKTTEKECIEQKIIYSSDSKRTWKTTLSTQILSDKPYNVLRNPPPLIAEGGYGNYRNPIWNTTESQASPTSKIIGRVYYVRGIQPTFEDDYQKWLKDITSNNGNHPYYLLAAITFVSCGMFIWLIAYLIIENIITKSKTEKEILNRQIQVFEQQVKSRLKLNQKLISEKEDLYKKLSEYKENLESHQSNQQTKEEFLQEEIIKLQALENEQKLELNSKTNSLQNLKEELSWIYKSTDSNTNFDLEVQNKQQEITSLNLEIQNKNQNLHLLTKSLQDQEKQLVNLRNLNSNSIKEIESLKGKLFEIITEKDEAKSKIFQLEEQLVKGSSNELEYILETVKMENEHLKASARDDQAFLNKAIENEEKAKNLTRERDSLQKTVNKKSAQTDQLISERNSLKAKNTELQNKISNLELQLELKDKINNLEFQIANYGDVKNGKVSINETNKLTIRPSKMSNIEFARNASIQIDPFPHDPKEEARKYYDNKNNGFDPKPLTQNGIVDFLSHKYSIYELLCREFSGYDESAANILKSKVNTKIWEQLYV